MSVKDWDERAIVQEFRHEQRQRERAGRYLFRPAADVPVKPNYMDFERAGTVNLVELLCSMGYTVSLTGNNAPYDAMVNGLPVEFKFSRYHLHPSKGGGRYQCAIRNRHAAVLILTTVSEVYYHFVIPMEAIKTKHIAITSYNVLDYRGQMFRYLENWKTLDRAIVHNTRQLSL